MIVGARAAMRPDFRGFNVLSFADWSFPPETLGLPCFGAFDESVLKGRMDPDATRISAPGNLSGGPTTFVHTATETALRSLPERHARSTRMHSLFVVNEGPDRFAWTDLPPWARVSVETAKGELELWSVANNAGAWTKLELRPDDLRLHLTLFHDLSDLRVQALSEPRFYRTADLIRAPRAVACFALDLI